MTLVPSFVLDWISIWKGYLMPTTIAFPLIFNENYILIFLPLLRCLNPAEPVLEKSVILCRIKLSRAFPRQRPFPANWRWSKLYATCLYNDTCHAQFIHLCSVLSMNSTFVYSSCIISGRIAVLRRKRFVFIYVPLGMKAVFDTVEYNYSQACPWGHPY